MKNIGLIGLFIGLFSWGSFAQTLSLDSCKSFALENNKSYKTAELGLNAANKTKQNAFTNYFPKVEAGAFTMVANSNLIEAETPEMNLPVYDGNPANIPTATEFAYIPGMELGLVDNLTTGYVTAVQPLFTGGRIHNGNQLAKMGADIKEDQLELTREEGLVKTETLYCPIVSLNQKKKTLKR